MVKTSIWLTRVLTLEIPSTFDQHKHPMEVILTPPQYLSQYLPNDKDFHIYVSGTFLVGSLRDILVKNCLF